MDRYVQVLFSAFQWYKIFCDMWLMKQIQKIIKSEVYLRNPEKKAVIFQNSVPKQDANFPYRL